MAEQKGPELAETNSEQPNSATEDMELESTDPALESTDPALESTDPALESKDDGTEGQASNGEANAKRAREETGSDGSGEENDGVSKKQKVGDEKSVEEGRLEKKMGEEESGRVSLGPKSFMSSLEMFDYFYKFLHYWPPNLNVNKYEQMVLLDLLKKGHAEPDKKIGGGIHAFQVRYHPTFKSRCFFLIRIDESYDDFSFRKCVDRILPLPEDMKVKSDANKALGGDGKGKGRGGRGGGRGGWRGGKWRN